MFRKILLAYDGSAGAKRALDVALELTSTFGAELWALAVEEPYRITLPPLVRWKKRRSLPITFIKKPSPSPTCAPSRPG